MVYENIRSGTDMSGTFDKEYIGDWKTTVFKFDLGSVMLYSSYSDTYASTRPSMLTKDGSDYEMGPRASTVDILEIQVVKAPVISYE